MNIKRYLFATAMLVGAFNVEAKVTLPSLLSDNAVFQRNTIVLLWGEAKPSHKVVVTPSWSTESYTTKSDSEGKWSVEVATTAEGEGYSITFDDGSVTKIDNILLGEVWLCSGQSNMEMPMRGNYGQPVEGAIDKIAKAKPSRPIRYYKVGRAVSNSPIDTTVGTWAEHTPEVVEGFSAAAYYFADYIQEVLDVPVGIISTSWGATTIETWMSREMLEGLSETDFSHLDSDEVVKDAQKYACTVHNAMIYPLRNYRFKGMLWYQGEGNRFAPELYSERMTTFIGGLRELFDCGDFPFYFAQIAPFSYKNGKMTALLREAQSAVPSMIDNCGMISLLDVGESTLIHPRNKKAVGERFAYWALGDTYNIKGIGYRVPQYRSCEVWAEDENLPARIAVKFSNASMGVCFGRDQEPQLFEVAGEDRVFYPAKVRSINSKGYHLEVWSADVPNPVAVRYAFKNYVKGEIFNNYGLPISSFRSDNWEVE